MSTLPDTSTDRPTARPGRRRAPLRAVLALAVALVPALLVLGTPGSAQAAGTQTPPGSAWVRTGHFVPGMGKADVVLAPDSPRRTVDPIEDLGYSDVSTYQKLLPGRYTASVSAVDADPDAEPLLSSSFDVTAGEARTVAVVGTADAPRLTLLDDDLTPPQADTARVRLLSATDSTDAVTVRALMGPTVADGAVLGQATPYKTVPAGPWTLALMGADVPESKQAVDIASGSVYTVVVVDAPGGGTELKVVTDAAGAVVTPKGGADTGLGGAAPAAPQASDASTALVAGGLAGLAGVLLLGGAGVLVARRRTAGSPS